MAVKAPPESTADRHPGAAGDLLRRLPLTCPSPSSSPQPDSTLPPTTALAEKPVATPTEGTAIAHAAPDVAGLSVVDDWAAICQPASRPAVLGNAGPSPDPLLLAGIGDYTVVPGVPLLGKGKFSVVYRATKGGQEFAVKHTPLHPHHPLIATRLIREPELLGQIAPHPNLVRVFETIRTEGHFYLIEEYLPTHISLDALCQRYPQQRLPYPLVLKILQQLVSVVRDGLHSHQVVHRDIKPENVLVDPETGHVTLIDMGLATPFSLSSAKLSTCCGSPAFHSPEIVRSLSRPAGEVHYWGPEVDAWCIALSVLRCWTGRRYPIGTGHKTQSVMRGRVEDVLALVSRDVMDSVDEVKRNAERELRETLRGLLNFDSERRMQALRDFDVGDEVRESVERFQRPREFKQTTFQNAPLKYSLPLHLALESLPPTPASPRLSTIPVSSAPEPPAEMTLVLRNPTDQHPVKVVSFLKYALRSANILYHVRSTEVQAMSAPGTPIRSIHSYFPLSGSSPNSTAGTAPVSPVPDLVPSPGMPPSATIFQCVATLPPMAPEPLPTAPVPVGPPVKERRPFLPSLFRSTSANSIFRSTSMPAAKRVPTVEKEQSQPQPQRVRLPISDDRKQDGEPSPRYVVFFLAMRFSGASAAAVAEERRQRRQRSVSRRGGSRSRGSSRLPPPAGSASAAQDLNFEELSSRLAAGSGDGSRRPMHNRHSSHARLSALNTDSGLMTPTTANISRHPSIRRERSASGSASGSVSTDSSPPMSPALGSGKPLAADAMHSAIGKRSLHVRPASRMRSITAPTSRASSLSRSSTSSGYGHPHLPSHHHPAHLTESVVLIHCSDAAALPALRAAFSVPSQSASTDAGTPSPLPASLALSLPDSPTAVIPIPLKLPPARQPSAKRQNSSSLDEGDEDDEPRRGRSEARSADSYSSSTSGSGGKLVKAMSARKLQSSTPMPTLRASAADQDDRTPTATPAPTNRQRQPSSASIVDPERDYPPTPYAYGRRLDSVSSEEDSNDITTPGVDEGQLDATRIVDVRKNSSASSVGELFEGLGLRGMTSTSAAEITRIKTPASRPWEATGGVRFLQERSRSVGLFDRC